MIVIASPASTHHKFSHEKKVDEATQKKNEWIELFDLV
jgi:hypothetical protein